MYYEMFKVKGKQMGHEYRADILCSTHQMHQTSLQKLAHAIYRDFFQNQKLKKKIFVHIFAQNIDCGYMLEPPRQGMPLHTPVLLFKSRV